MNQIRKWKIKWFFIGLKYRIYRINNALKKWFWSLMPGRVTDDCEWCGSRHYSKWMVTGAGEVVVCPMCSDDALECPCCGFIEHPDHTVDMPEGWYCQDCWDAVYG